MKFYSPCLGEYHYNRITNSSVSFSDYVSVYFYTDPTAQNTSVYKNICKRRFFINIQFKGGQKIENVFINDKRDDALSRLYINTTLHQLSSSMKYIQVSGENLLFNPAYKRNRTVEFIDKNKGEMGFCYTCQVRTDVVPFLTFSHVPICVICLKKAIPDIEKFYNKLTKDELHSIQTDQILRNLNQTNPS